MAYQRRKIKPAKPTRVAEVLEGYLRSAGLAQRLGLAAVVDAWPQLVGPRIARAAVAESVGADGTLFVRVPSSAWRQELSLMAPEILDLVNRGRKDGRIARIRWLVGEERQEPDGRTPGIRDGKSYGRTGVRAYRDGRKGPGSGQGGA
jgi:predicted nucleic acid-binding Zn ribbon protein